MLSHALRGLGVNRSMTINTMSSKSRSGANGSVKALLILCGLLIAFSAHSENAAVLPEQFLASALMVRPGIDDLEGMTVGQYTEVMKRIPLNDGTTPKLLGWQRTNNRYVLRAQFLDQLFVLRFVHDLSTPSNGRYTLLESAEVDGEPADPMQMTMLFLSASPKRSAQRELPASRPTVAPENDPFAPLTPSEFAALVEVSKKSGLDQMVRAETVELLDLASKGQEVRIVAMTLTQDQKHLYQFGALPNGGGYLIGLITPEGAAHFRLDTSGRLLAAIWRPKGQSATMMSMDEASAALPRAYPWLRHALKATITDVSP